MQLALSFEGDWVVNLLIDDFGVNDVLNVIILTRMADPEVVVIRKLVDGVALHIGLDHFLF